MMTMRAVLPLAGALLMTSLPSMASAADGGWSLLGFGQFTNADDRGPSTDEGIGFRIGLEKEISSWLALQGYMGYQEFEADSAGGLSQDEYAAGLDYKFNVIPKLGKLEPFLIAGIGVARTADVTAPNSVSNDLFWQAGAGASYRISDSRFKLTGDIKHRALYFDENRGQQDPHEEILSLGVSYDLGAPPKVIVVGAKSADGDADSDGVPDSLDRCPGTAPGTAVDAYGCAVSSVGDSDGDGIPDNMDRCPNTPAGTPVDGEGCPAPETVVIYFAFDSAELNGAARKALDVVAGNLAQRSYVVAIANGHADRTGTEAYNQDLSQRRAEAVASYLSAQGVADNQLRTRAFGETRPVNAGETPEQRARNRRVEINLVEER